MACNLISYSTWVWGRSVAVTDWCCLVVLDPELERTNQASYLEMQLCYFFFSPVVDVWCYDSLPECL